MLPATGPGVQVDGSRSLPGSGYPWVERRHAQLSLNALKRGTAAARWLIIVRAYRWL